ncbi:MAG: TonB family protein [Gammaproteobacteria bacterium]|nr:TonB family protein [Gammaproteobacteria bacterium]
MLVQDWTRLSKLALILILACGSAQANTGLEPAGLATYTETSRDIYLAALLTPAGSSLENVYLAPGPKAMEYRIATRRISSRGFSGTLLLQAEMGSGSRAPKQVIKVLNQLKSIMKGALIKGDRFVIALSADDATTFYLNDTRLLDVIDGSVFDFFFAGWVGKSSSTLLRDNLLAGELNPAILARYEALRPNQDRVAAIADWMAPAAPEAPTAKPQQVAKTPEPAAEKLSTAAAAATPKTTTTAIAGAEKPEPRLAKKVQVKAPAKEKPGQVAASEKAPAPATAAGKNDIEYQRKLGSYVTNVRTKVYGEVSYPRRAIKKQRQGKVELLARLDRSGELLDVTLDNSSGYTILDNAARRAVHRAAPFPELPPEAIEEFVADDGESYVVMIPVTFQLLN